MSVVSVNWVETGKEKLAVGILMGTYDVDFMRWLDENGNAITSPHRVVSDFYKYSSSGYGLRNTPRRNYVVLYMNGSNMVDLNQYISKEADDRRVKELGDKYVSIVEVDID